MPKGARSWSDGRTRRDDRAGSGECPLAESGSSVRRRPRAATSGRTEIPSETEGTPRFRFAFPADNPLAQGGNRHADRDTVRIGGRHAPPQDQGLEEAGQGSDLPAYHELVAAGIMEPDGEQVPLHRGRLVAGEAILREEGNGSSGSDMSRRMATSPMRPENSCGTTWRATARSTRRTARPFTWMARHLNEDLGEEVSDDTLFPRSPTADRRYGLAR